MMQVEKWVKEALNHCIEVILNSEDPFLRVQHLSQFGILTQLAKDTGMELSTTNNQVTKKITDLYAESRHFFHILPEEFDPFSVLKPKGGIK